MDGEGIFQTKVSLSDSLSFWTCYVVKRGKTCLYVKSSYTSLWYKFQNLEVADSLRIEIQWFLSWWRTHMLSLDLNAVTCSCNCVFSFCSKITVCLRYADLVSVLPTRVKVLAWPTCQFKKDSISAPTPARLSYAEDALRNMSLPEGIYFLMRIDIFFFSLFSTIKQPDQGEKNALICSIRLSSLTRYLLAQN